MEKMWKVKGSQNWEHLKSLQVKGAICDEEPEDVDAIWDGALAKSQIVLRILV